MWPTIVAESLAPVAMPIATALEPGAAAPPGSVAAALAASLALPEADSRAPDWLWSSQRLTYRRVLAAIGNHGGAILADPVGSGKTYVALAAAQSTNRDRPTVCLVPAALRDQWERASRRTGVPVVVSTHQRASRGGLPPHSGRLVVIDESHRYRNPTTRGFAHVATWLLGRRALLLSATPVVNRLDDLAHQLSLTVRDDALAGQAVASISALLGAGRTHPALERVLLSTGVGPEFRPRAVERTEFLDPSADTLERRLAGIDGLALSPDPGVAVLLRSAFWRAAGSSAAALVATLRRYRRLLLHARDAAAAGQQPTRQALLRLTAGLSDQLLMWQLLPEAAGALELIADDLPRVDELIADLVKELGRDDLKVARLRLLLADGRSTIVFTVSRETVRWLRDRLGCRVAWCTGQHAGVGMTRTSRQTVLSWFGADAPARRGLLGGRFAPAHLVSTDVAAEGLDLQGAERVVHYDLPWTPMRLEQRRGRIVRAGSCHPDVEIVRFDPPAPLERRLKHAELLLRKARLPAMVGLGEAAESWRWRGALAAGFEDIVATRGVAAIAAEPAGVLAGFTVHPWPDSGRAPLAAHVLWWTEECGWTDAPTTIKQRLALAASVAPAPVERAPCRWALEQLGRVVRDHVRTIRRASWELPAPSPPARALLSRLDLLARAAARQRHSATLAQIQRAIAFAAGGHTAGERREVERLAGLGDPELTAALPRVPGPTAIPAVLQARVTGVILFLGAATFPRCRPTTRSSLTSTER